jgi:uncharacterized damage-inducible protein DinB
MQDDRFDLAEAMAILERTPSALQSLLAGLPERWVRASAGHGDWSPYDVVGHLIDGERTNWLPRARHILAGEPAPFPPFDRSAHLAANHKTLIDDLLATFADLRRANIAALRGVSLTSADLERTGLHPEFGEVRLAQLIATWVVHDLNHLGQIAQAMSRVYADAVGPWRAYLAILDDRA